MFFPLNSFISEHVNHQSNEYGFIIQLSLKLTTLKIGAPVGVGVPSLTILHSGSLKFSSSIPEKYRSVVSYFS